MIWRGIIEGTGVPGLALDGSEEALNMVESIDVRCLERLSLVSNY